MTSDFCFFLFLLGHCVLYVMLLRFCLSICVAYNAMPPGKEEVLKRHGNESFYADNTRGSYAHPELQDYVEVPKNVSG